MDRCTGRTTRAVDGAIQDLFHTGKCVVWDHVNSRKSNSILLDKVIQRLQNEHPHIMNKIIVDIKELSISIK